MVLAFWATCVDSGGVLHRAVRIRDLSGAPGSADLGVFGASDAFPPDPALGHVVSPPSPLQIAGPYVARGVLQGHAPVVVVTDYAGNFVYQTPYHYSDALPGDDRGRAPWALSRDGSLVVHDGNDTLRFASPSDPAGRAMPVPGLERVLALADGRAIVVYDGQTALGAAVDELATVTPTGEIRPIDATPADPLAPAGAGELLSPAAGLVGDVGFDGHHLTWAVRDCEAITIKSTANVDAEAGPSAPGGLPDCGYPTVLQHNVRLDRRHDVHLTIRCTLSCHGTIADRYGDDGGPELTTARHFNITRPRQTTRVRVHIPYRETPPGTSDLSLDLWFYVADSRARRTEVTYPNLLPPRRKHHKRHR